MLTALATVVVAVLSSGSATASGTADAIAPRPPIVLKQIPFGPNRRAQAAAYALRHYGIRTWRLGIRA